MPLPGDTCAEEGAPLTWKRHCISFSLTDRNKPDPPLDRMRDVADASFRAWSEVSCGTKPVGLSIRETEALAECNSPEYNRTASNSNTVIFVSDWAARKLPRDAFGLTLVWHNPQTGEIYDADMQINETLGTLAICNGTCPAGQVDLQNVITHVAGHFLGLGHSTDLQATMAARATVGETKKRDLDADDREGLCSIYQAQSSGDPKCDAAAYEPDCGFSPICTPPQEDATCKARTTTRSTSGCSVLGTNTERGAAGLSGLAFVLASVVLRQRSARRRKSRGA